MKTATPNKKPWIKPCVQSLNIKKDTFSATKYGGEKPFPHAGKIPKPFV
ncbi:MAG TPA: hypothetical protein PK711_10675 [Bacteroidales bacterium]|nr:hypothetical protein [Bacteroidales bacterium]